MSFFQPDQDLPQHPFIPRRLLREEPWGEVWQVLHRDSATTMLLVAWCTPEGDALFAEIEDGIRRWKEVAGTVNCPHMLRIVELSDSAIPYALVEDPGGFSLRDEVSGRRNEPPQGEGIAKLGMHLATAILETEAYDCGPVVLTPDCIFHCPGDRDNPFKLLPVAPRAHSHAALIGGGRYLPKEFASTQNPVKIHPDIYAIPFILTEVWRRDFESPAPQAIADVIPLKGLAYTLDSLTKLVQGIYTEPNVAAQGFERWIKKQMAQDIAAFEQAEIERKRGPLLNFLVKQRGVIIGVSIFLIVATGTGFGVYYFLTTRPKAKPKIEQLQKTEPNDIVTLYLRAVEEKDPSLAGEVTIGTDLVEQTRAILTQLKPLGDVAKIERQMAGGDEGRIVEARLEDSSGRPMGAIVLELRQRANFEWYVTTAFLKPTSL